MTYGEFSNLLSGLGPKTPLGAIVSIRAENDPKIIKSFSPEQKRIRNEWRRREAKKMSKETLDKIYAGLNKAFADLKI